MSCDLVQTYLLRIPDHASVPREALKMFLDDALACLDKQVWGAQYETAAIYLAAHEVELTPGYGSFNADETSPLAGQSDGDLQRQYATQGGGYQGAPGVDDYLSLTLYGKRYMAMRQRLAGIQAFVATPRGVVVAGQTLP